MTRQKNSQSNRLGLYVLIFLVIVKEGLTDFSNDEDPFPWDIFERDAEMLPDDITMFVGDKVKVYCTLSSSSTVTDTSDVIFKLTYISHDVDELKSDIINSTQVMTILEGTEKMKGRSTLSCINGTNELGSVSIFVQEPLTNVTDVTSIYYYPENKFEIMWKYGASYFEPEYHIEVDIFWTANDISPNGGRHSCNRTSKLDCTVLDFKLQSILFFHLKVKLSPNEWAIYIRNKEYFVTPQNLELPYRIYEVQPMTKVRTDRPRNLMVEGKTSRCFNISWTSPQFFQRFHEDNLYRIYGKQKDHNFQELINSSLEFSKETTKTVEVCDLVPNTDYELTLEVKPKEGGYWSQSSQVKAFTLEDRPEFGPPMTLTSFWVGMCNEGKRDIILYWRDLTAREKNGVLTNYRLKFNSESGYTRSSNNHLKASRDCDVTYRVEVYSSTIVGETLNPSILTIHSKNEAFHGPFPVDLIVEKLSGSSDTDLMSVNVTWPVEDLKHFQGVSLVFYYCQGEAFSTRVCIDNFQYKVVAFKKQHLELENISQSVNRFGYALEKDANNLTGITWIDCVYDPKEKPAQVDGVTLDPGKELGSIRVVWRAQRCSKKTLAYYVRYCTQSQVTSGSRCPEKKVGGGDNARDILQGLDVDEKYTISVCAEASNGRGMYSSPVTIKPNTGTEDDPKVQNIILIVIIIVLIIAGALVCLCCKFRQRKKKMEKNMYPYTPFEVVNPEKKFVSQKSDSGISSNSTQVVSSITGEVEEYDDVNPSAKAGISSGQSNPVEQMDSRPIAENPLSLEKEGSPDVPTKTEEENSLEPEIPKLEFIFFAENAVTNNKCQGREELNILQSGYGGTGNGIESSEETNTDTSRSNPSHSDTYMHVTALGNLADTSKNGYVSRDEPPKMSALHSADLVDGSIESSVDTETDLSNSNPSHSDAYMHVTALGNFEIADIPRNGSNGNLAVADTNKNDYVARDELLNKEENIIESWVVTDTNSNPSDTGAYVCFTTFDVSDGGTGNSIDSSVAIDIDASSNNPSQADLNMVFTPIGNLQVADTTENDYVARDEEPQNIENIITSYSTDLDDGATGNCIESLVDTDTDGSNSDPSHTDAYVCVGAVSMNSNYIPPNKATGHPIKTTDPIQEDDAMHIAFKSGNSRLSHLNQNPCIPFVSLENNDRNPPFVNTPNFSSDYVTNTNVSPQSYESTFETKF